MFKVFKVRKVTVKRQKSTLVNPNVRKINKSNLLKQTNKSCQQWIKTVKDSSPAPASLSLPPLHTTFQVRENDASVCILKNTQEIHIGDRLSSVFHSIPGYHRRPRSP